MTIGFHIKKRRKELGQLQAEVATNANTTESVICRIERGTRQPNGELLQRLAAALETTVRYLLGEVDAEAVATARSLPAEVVFLQRRVQQLEEEVSLRQCTILFLQSVIDRLLPQERRKRGA